MNYVILDTMAVTEVHRGEPAQNLWKKRLGHLSSDGILKIVEVSSGHNASGGGDPELLCRRADDLERCIPAAVEP